MGRVDLDKLRSINFGGRLRDQARARIQRNDAGRIATIHIDHPDGSTEAVVRPGATRSKVSAASGEVINGG